MVDGGFPFVGFTVCLSFCFPGKTENICSGNSPFAYEMERRHRQHPFSFFRLPSSVFRRPSCVLAAKFTELKICYYETNRRLRLHKDINGSRPTFHVDHTRMQHESLGDSGKWPWTGNKGRRREGFRRQERGVLNLYKSDINLNINAHFYLKSIVPVDVSMWL